MDTKNIILRNTFYSSISIYTEYLLGLVCSIVIARSLGSSEYGIYSLFLWIAASSIFLINGGLNITQIKYLSELRKAKDHSHAVAALSYFRKIQTWKTIIVILTAIALHKYILELLKLSENKHYFWLILAAVIFRGRYMFYVSCAKGFEAFHKLSVLALIVTPINLILILLAAFYNVSLEYFIYIYFIIGVLFYLTSRILISNEFTTSKIAGIDEEYKTRIHNYLKITTITAILGYFVMQGFELFMLGWLSTADQVAMFRIGLLLASSIMLLIPGVFSSVLLPSISSSLATSSNLANRRFYDSTRFLIILAIPVVAIISFLSKDLILILYGSEYLEASFALSICTIALAVGNIANSAQSYLLSAEKQKIIFYILVLSLLLKLSFGYYLILNYALYGAVLTFFITCTLANYARIHLACKYTKTKFPFLTLSKTSICSLISLIPLYLIDYFFKSHLLTIIIQGVLFGICFLLATFIAKLWTQEDYLLFETLISKIKIERIKSALSKFFAYVR